MKSSVPRLEFALAVASSDCSCRIEVALISQAEKSLHALWLVRLGEAAIQAPLMRTVPRRLVQVLRLQR